MAEMKSKGLKGFGKMGDDFESKPKPMSQADGEAEHEQGGEEHTTTITHHADGSHTMDGEHHPSHLHMLAKLGHKVTGGDKHHIVHSDGIGHTSHGIHESGEHDGPHEHNSAEEAKEAMGHFLDEEAQEPEHQEGAEEEKPEPAYGEM